MPALTRGPLPASVYWRRRAVVLIVPLVLVVGLAEFAGSGGGGVSGARLAANHTRARHHHAAKQPDAPTSPDSSSAPVVVSSDSPSASASPTVLPAPEGNCAASDVVVTPTVAQASAGGAVDLALSLHTDKSVACTWPLSHRSLQVAITEAGAPVWSTVDCPTSVPTESVVVRRDSTTTIDVPWSGRYSAAGCAGHTDWATPGKYVAEAASMGGNPAELDFSLVHEAAGTPASNALAASGTATPSSNSSSSASAGASASASTSPSGSASSSPAAKSHGSH